MKTCSYLRHLALAIALAAAPAAFAQGPTTGYNPYLVEGIIRNENGLQAPMLPAEFGGRGTVELDVGNTGATPIAVVPGDLMTIVISLSKGVPDVANPNDPAQAVAAITGPGAAWFSWTYDPNPLVRSFIGTQIATIPAESRQQINIPYRVAENSFLGNVPTVSNGFNANIQPPAYTNPQPTDDDAVSSYTYVEATDFGDAPSSYLTASHNVLLTRDTSLRYNRLTYLGTHLDADTASQHSANTDGDDVNTASGLSAVVADDEDGIVFPSVMIPGETYDVPVTISVHDYHRTQNRVPMVLFFWIDWNNDGEFAPDEASLEPILGEDGFNVETNVVRPTTTVGDPFRPGKHSYTFNVSVEVPLTATPGNYYSRLRFGPGLLLPNDETDPATHGEVEDHQFEITSLGGISGVVGVDTNGDGTADLFESGVTLTLRDSSGNVVLVGGNPVTTTTNSSGAYTFTGLVPGSYQVLKTPLGTYVPYSDIDGGNPNLIGSNTNIVVTGGATNAGNNFLEILQKCPDTWLAWQAKWNVDLGGQTGPTQNPDGDRYDNLIEYAFCLPPHLGIRKPFCLSPSLTVSGAIDGTYTRTAIGGAKDVTYVLEWTTTLDNPTAWTGSKVLLDTDPALDIVNDGQGGETVTITDLETFTGLAAGTGFVRIRVDLDNGATVASDATDVLGWKQTDFPVCGSTYSNPFLECAVYTGTVASATGQVLTFTDSGEGFNLGTLLSPGVAYYIEVETGALAGHRFDVVSAGVGSLTLQTDSDALSYEPPFNTVANLDLATLQGSRIALHRAKTLDMLFPPGGFGAAALQTTADQVQLFVGNQWRIFWLSNTGGPPAWTDTMGGGLAGSRVIPPGRGMFFNNRNALTGLLAFGEVREHSFANPLAAGSNLVGGGYPVGQSPAGADSRQLNRSGGFFGSRDFKTADSVFRWRGDTNSLLTGYDSYFLLYNISPAVEKWVRQDDATRAAQNAALIFEGDRSVFQRVRDGVSGYRIAAPWAPGEVLPPPPIP